MDLKNLLFTSELSKKAAGAAAAPIKPPAFLTPPPPPIAATPAPGGGASLAPMNAPASLGHLLPTLLELKGQILRELENNPLKMRAFNKSRREKLMKYLERVASLPPSPPAEADAVLDRWLEGPRTPAQNLAIQTYFEEIALLVLGQILVLKAWSDRGLRPWRPGDIGKLNWELGSALRALVPLDRETWNIARATIYSWYTPSPSLQAQIWASLEHWKLGQEGPGLLSSLLCGSGKSPSHPRLEGYDPRFFQALWDALPSLGFDPEPEAGPLRRRKQVFSPTLRDGTIVRTAPPALQWVGTEQSAFLLMSAELIQLWWGPCEPPHWARMDGLETHSRDQLSLDLMSAKPSLLSRIKDMESFDLAFVLEERALRAQGRSAEAHRFREQLDQLPYFKKLRASGTSLGDLQACVALTKLRPGGLLWWAREEALSSVDGQETLRFLLDRGRLVAEWDLSRLEHGLPSNLPLFPKHLYLFAREPRIEERLSHRPLKLTVQGQLRSHVEVPLALKTALLSLTKPQAAHAHWQVHSHLSPSRQKDWLERWPDGSAQESLHRLEKLREASLPLATACTVRSTPEGELVASRASATAAGRPEVAWTVPRGVKGLWLKADYSIEDGARRLRAEILPEPGTEVRAPAPSAAPALSSVLVLIPHDAHLTVLAHYLESAPVREWLEHHAERRADRWVLSEQTVKFIPVPKSLLTALGVPHESLQDPVGTAQELPAGDWERVTAELARDPGPALAKFRQLARSPFGADEIERVAAPLFVRASRAIHTLQARRHQVSKVICPGSDGKISWRALLGILAAPECTSVTFHPQIKVEGQLPPHMAIERIERIANPAPGILFMTSLGINLKILPEAPALLEMLWDQLQGIEHPTWGELVKYLKVPRRLEVAQETAAEILRTYREVQSMIDDLKSLQEEIAQRF